MLDVSLPGTGGTVPQIDRHLSCAYFRFNGVGLLIDCGEGTQLAVKKAGFSLGRISTILLTHFHADHCSGLPGLLLSMGNEGRTDPLLICGPKGVDEIVKALTIIAPELPFRIRTQVLGDFDSIDRGDFRITAFELHHSSVCLGYDIRIDRSGKFDRQKAENNGVPMKYWSKLQKGESIDGYTPDMVLGESRRGIHVTFATDSRPSDIIATMAAEADLLICEGMFEAEKSARAKESAHMTMAEAARLAKEAECEELWLTHYSPSLPDPSVCIDEAISIFPHSVQSYDGITKTIRFVDEQV
ncbi:MAG: ribonuclease Z [Clostridia bacterium]|nr:ribonuclease Z [Clostridia bacterium]MBQ8511758.1 ribonuclease Z [Clostridia bacterium]